MHKNGSGGDSRERIERIDKGLGNGKLKKLQGMHILTNELQDIEQGNSRECHDHLNHQVASAVLVPPKGKLLHAKGLTGLASV